MWVTRMCLWVSYIKLVIGLLSPILPECHYDGAKAYPPIFLLEYTRCKIIKFDSFFDLIVFSKIVKV